MPKIAMSRLNSILDSIIERCEPLLEDGKWFRVCVRANKNGTPRIDNIPRNGISPKEIYGDDEFIVVLDDRDVILYRKGVLTRKDLTQLVKEALLGLGLS